MAVAANVWVHIGARTDGFNKGIGGVQKSLKGLDRQLSGFQRNMTRVSSTLGGLGRTMMAGITLPIVAAGGAIIKAGIDFDKAMTESTAIMGDLSDATRTDMEMAARQVAKTSTFSAAEAAEAYYFLASAGMDATQSMAAMPKVAQFAQAGNFDLARATSLLADTQSTLGLTVRDDVIKNMENMTRVSDVLTKAQVMANASTEQFAESLTNKAGAAMRLLGKDIEEGVAVLSVMAHQGLKGAAAGERFGIIMRDMQKAYQDSPAIFKKHGVAVYDATGSMSNMADIIEDLELALKGMSDQQVRATLSSFGFQEESIAATASLLGFSAAIRRYEKAYYNAFGTTKDVAARQLNALGNQLKLVKNKLTDTALTIFNTFEPAIAGTVMPALDEWLKKLEKLAEGFAALSPEEQQQRINWVLLAAAAGPVLWALGGIAGVLANLTAFARLLVPLIGLLAKGIGGLGPAGAIAVGGLYGILAFMDYGVPKIDAFVDSLNRLGRVKAGDLGEQLRPQGLPGPAGLMGAGQVRTLEDLAQAGAPEFLDMYRQEQRQYQQSLHVTFGELPISGAGAVNVDKQSMSQDVQEAVWKNLRRGDRRIPDRTSWMGIEY